MARIDFASLLQQIMGLDPDSIGSATIERAVKSRMETLEFAELEGYWNHLRASDQELQELIETVVVPETWFFRDHEAFVALGRLTREEWWPVHAHSSLRVLSVPCCTGEEPYSITMALLDAGIPRRQIAVDAVDISARALACAKRGSYGSNSFRGTNLDFRDHYFERVSAGYRLTDEIRECVAFHHENILSPKFRTGAAPYDVIFCRNVLIYFDSPTQQRVMETLDRLLAPTGFLFVGPAEASLAARTGFQHVNQTMSFAFRRHGELGKGSAPLNKKRFIDSRPTVATRRSVVQPHSLRPTISLATLPEPANLEDASRLADAGQLKEAGALCETHLKQQGPSSKAYYLLGLLRDATGDGEGAADCYRKVLYLEPSHTEALLHLAVLSERQGDRATAARLRERARRGARNAKEG
jgi:chemotaxis protein methyltransferase WspC